MKRDACPNVRFNPSANKVGRLQPPSNLLGQNQLGLVRVNAVPSNSERLFDGFRVGWNRLWAGLCYLDYLYDLNAAKEHRESEHGKKHRKLW